MATVRQLGNYLPGYMQNYEEMRAIMDAETPEVGDAWDGVANVWDQQYLQIADEEGVARREKMYDISPRLSDTLEERKFRIYTIVNQELPYTVPKLDEILTNLCGADGYTIVINGFSITIKLALGNKNNYDDVVKLLTKMIPANMVQNVQLMYNTHEVLHGFTHAELSAFTHQELREEVM